MCLTLFKQRLYLTLPYLTEDWYKFYTYVMGKVGWVLQDVNFSKYRSTGTSFKISQVVLQVLSALIGGDEELMNVVKDTLDGLEKSPTGVELFGSKSATQKQGNFQILPCTVDKSNLNQVNVCFLGSYFQASQVDSNYCFFTYSTTDITLFQSSQVFSLNEGAYALVREGVKKKLGKGAMDFVHDLDI